MGEKGNAIDTPAVAEALSVWDRAGGAAAGVSSTFTDAAAGGVAEAIVGGVDEARKERRAERAAEREAADADAAAADSDEPTDDATGSGGTGREP